MTAIINVDSDHLVLLQQNKTTDHNIEQPIQSNLKIVLEQLKSVETCTPIGFAWDAGGVCIFISKYFTWLYLHEVPK